MELYAKIIIKIALYDMSESHKENEHENSSNTKESILYNPSLLCSIQNTTN